MKFLFKKVCISSDHAGFDYKDFIKDFLIKKNISVIDLGPAEKKSVDYPDFAKKVTKRIISKKSEIGILICGSGTGMSISANKIKGIRAAVCFNQKSTYLCRSHNDANIICIGSRLTNKKDIKKIITIFLNTKFEGGRHGRRIRKI